MSFFNQRLTNYISRKKFPTSVYDFENSMRLKRGLKPEAFVSIPQSESSQYEAKTLQEVIDEGKANTNWRYIKARKSEGPRYITYFLIVCFFTFYKVVRVVENQKFYKNNGMKSDNDSEIGSRRFQDKLE
ncbi:unnamed protein product [Blepharisma stoltei]|uniref:Uncharacterized protein n=1 Tax=Blepharisma stoltei TaxID=1481888 RepID=A0AAU9K2W8_9CILI|nr:unnamed protein product [Blepharisma stoltei]